MVKILKLTQRRPRRRSTGSLKSLLVIAHAKMTWVRREWANASSCAVINP